MAVTEDNGTLNASLAWHKSMSAVDTALYTALAMDLMCPVAALQGLHQRLLKGSAVWVHNIDCVVCRIAC